jgi:hypothetical protein
MAVIELPEAVARERPEVAEMDAAERQLEGASTSTSAWSGELIESAVERRPFSDVQLPELARRATVARAGGSRPSA